MELQDKLKELLSIYSKREVYDLTGVERTTLWRVENGESFCHNTFIAIEKLHGESKRKIAAKRRAK